MKRAIILAAGTGSRLLPSANTEHKALLHIGGQSLIERQIEMLQSAGITSVSVVVGHAADRIKSLLKDKVSYIHNSRYGETNSLYSLWLALNQWSGPFVLLNCDLLFHPSILDRLLNTNGSALAYDSDSGTESEQMKVSLKEGRIAALAKDLPRDKVGGENIGLLKFDRQTVPFLYMETNYLVESGQLNQWAPAAVSAVSQSHPIRAVDIADLPWVEIDYPHDLDAAHTEICPSIPGCAFGPVSDPHDARSEESGRFIAGGQAPAIHDQPGVPHAGLISDGI